LIFARCADPKKKFWVNTGTNSTVSFPLGGTGEE
jgi:hypothetical protein